MSIIQTTVDWCCKSICEREGGPGACPIICYWALYDCASTATDQTAYTSHSHTLKLSVSGCMQLDKWYLRSIQNLILLHHLQWHILYMSKLCSSVAFHTWLHFQHCFPQWNEWTYLNSNFKRRACVFYTNFRDTYIHRKGRECVGK